MNLVPGLTDPSMASGDVDLKAFFLMEYDAALLKMSATGGTLTADGTEQTLYYDDEPLGVFKPSCLLIDLDLMQGGDTVEIRIYHRLKDAGSLQLLSYVSYTGADGGLSNGMKVVSVDLCPCRHGFRATIQQSAGTNRDFDWELFVEI